MQCCVVVWGVVRPHVGQRFVRIVSARSARGRDSPKFPHVTKWIYPLTDQLGAA